MRSMLMELQKLRVGDFQESKITEGIVASALFIHGGSSIMYTSMKMSLQKEFSRGM